MSQAREIFEMHDEIEALKEKIAALEKTQIYQQTYIEDIEADKEKLEEELEEFRGEETYIPVKKKLNGIFFNS